MDAEPDVIVIGSGPAGLSSAADLVARGVPTTVLERGSGIGAAWSARYDALRFNTGRLHSALHGAPFPREYGQFPTRDQYVAYLRGYAQRRSVEVEHGIEGPVVLPSDVRDLFEQLVGRVRHDPPWRPPATSTANSVSHCGQVTRAWVWPSWLILR